MPYERRYLIELRIFEPLVVHPDLEDYPVSDNRTMILRLAGEDADARLISLPPDPVADSYRGTPIMMTGADAGDGIDRVCPLQDDIRSWHALEALSESSSKAELDAMVPKSARRRAAAHRVEWLQGEPDTRVFTRTSAWDVSPVWWLAIDPEEDQVIADETEHGHRVRIRVPILTAASRVEWAVSVLKEKSRLSAVVESAEQFSDWLDSFDMNSIVELDLGGMSEIIYPETGADLVSDWVDALDADDRESAIAAFNAYTRQWEALGLYARGS
ncbi:hypothetical protein GSY69_02275 [Brevibacterium sp. 5221]|uniref:DUF8083 domain-containing protein n=1 Tax=Brevibacterium rongguiense TaxID=2695267 RepID=A0A6N9H4Y1_9MICO|nr:MULTISPECIES: hypothetical protein [Brevibacterium]MYM18836.1 hypothetical protein [Brevibacterium rongguiense]WAL39905.1 hypothetical protein BRM1_11730 [Brevibacterium sp. BRM-1]